MNNVEIVDTVVELLNSIEEENGELSPQQENMVEEARQILSHVQIMSWGSQ